MAFALDKVREIAERVAESSALILWDIELKGSGANRTLRIYIDKPEGVTHEDCSAYSREVATIFDVEDAVPGVAYVLEISSPGLDRKLFKPEHFARFTGSLVKFSTRDLVNGNRHFEGRLVSFSEGQLTVDLDQVASRKKAKAQGAGVIVVAFSNVEKASLVPEF
ncbi:MAG: ribosome maturation factor RimP [Candidatus Korobacteraceae bacterium]|jgi:ribosome maturation factor RimP